MFIERGIKYISIPNLLWTMFRGKRMEEVEHKIILENGTVFGTTIFMSPAFVVAEPELLQIILSKEFTNFTDRRVSFIYLFFSYLLSSLFLPGKMK